MRWNDLNTDPPRVNVILGRRFTAEEIREGSNVYLECQTRANPPIQRLTWMHNVSQYYCPPFLYMSFVFFFLLWPSIVVDDDNAVDEKTVNISLCVCVCRFLPFLMATKPIVSDCSAC